MSEEKTLHWNTSENSVLPTDTLLVGFDMTHGKNNRILIVGHKEGNYLQVVNAFQGDKAEEIYKLLTTRQEKSDG